MLQPFPSNSAKPSVMLSKSGVQGRSVVAIAGPYPDKLSGYPDFDHESFIRIFSTMIRIMSRFVTRFNKSLHTVIRLGFYRIEKEGQGSQPTKPRLKLIRSGCVTGFATFDLGY
ncbi:hypothetical protein PoB_004542300 [Plakobranchus ocellatus]|uniref:Uncharacterized protein n=1 Tax=Plakobranchus ocellatus TaxID=259542 RepID=A0AAV4BIC1_9GAST|nr:hypothetical protein PoB_004542300 [Plakobranchus ocellatus]